MTLSLSIFGLGYVGSVSAACLASRGFPVVGVDVNPAKAEMINRGVSPIVEPGVTELVAAAHGRGCLRGISDPLAAVRDTQISFICVGTPGLRSGKLDLSHVEQVCREIGQAIKHKREHHTVVVRSTVLPGTTASVVVPTLEAESGKCAGKDFSVCVNPEFMREGSAVADFMAPPMTILGSDEEKPLSLLRELYAGLPGRVFETSIPVAEMVKYSCNSFHALKVCFANEIGTLCKEMGVETQAVMEIFTSDTKLNLSATYLKPGFAFGGSCLPKDVRALAYRARELDLRLPLLDSLLPSNQEHIERAVQQVLNTGKRRVGVLGLSFKAGTDDLRESPTVQVVKRLLGEGCRLQVWDDNVALGRLVGSNRQFIEDTIPHIGSLLCDRVEEVIGSAEVVLLGTTAVSREQLQSYLRPEQVLIDLVNLDKSNRAARSAASYAGICW